MKTEIRDLAMGDTVFMFGGHRAPPSGAEVVVRRVGHKYLYVAGLGHEAKQYPTEYKFDRERGVEDANTNYKRYLIIDRDAYLHKVEADNLFERLRRNMGFKREGGVTTADIEAAAKLLQVDLKKVK